MTKILVQTRSTQPRCTECVDILIRNIVEIFVSFQPVSMPSQCLEQQTLVTPAVPSPCRQGNNDSRMNGLVSQEIVALSRRGKEWRKFGSKRDDWTWTEYYLLFWINKIQNCHKTAVLSDDKFLTREEINSSKAISSLCWKYDNQVGLSQKTDMIILSNQRQRKQPCSHGQSSVQQHMGEGSNPALTGMTSEVSNLNLRRFVKSRQEKSAIKRTHEKVINTCLIYISSLYLPWTTDQGTVRQDQAEFQRRWI